MKRKTLGIVVFIAGVFVALGMAGGVETEHISFLLGSFFSACGIGMMWLGWMLGKNKS